MSVRHFVCSTLCQFDTLSIRHFVLRHSVFRHSVFRHSVLLPASTGSQLFKSLYEVTDFNCLYHVTVHNCLYTSLIQLFIIGGGLNHTSVPGAASAWAAGTLLQSAYGGAYGRTSWKRVSLMKALSAAGWWFQSRQPWAAGPDVRQRLLLKGRCLWRRWYPGVGNAAAADTQFQTSASELPQPLVQDES